MKSKRLLILLAPFTLGVNAETVSESVSLSTAGQKQEIIQDTKPQISSVQTPGINQSVVGEQLPSVSVTTEVAPKQVSSENMMPVEQQLTEVNSGKVHSSVPESAEDWQLLPQTNEEADLVNKMFDKKEQNSIQANPNISPEMASKVEVSTGTDGSSLHVAESAISAKTAATSDMPTSQSVSRPVINTDINKSNIPTGSALQFVQTPLFDGSLEKQKTLTTVPMPRFIPASIPNNSDKAVTSTAFKSQSISKPIQSNGINKSNVPISSASGFIPASVPGTTELVKENVSDYLVSQAQNKINEVNPQSEEELKQDVHEIHESIEGINGDLASIKENLSILTVAIAEKAGNIDATLLKSDDAKGLKKEKTSSDTLSVIDEQNEITPQDNDNRSDAYDEYSETKSSKRIQGKFGKKISHDSPEEQEDVKQHEKILANELEEETLLGELSKDKILENDVDAETGVLSNSEQKDDMSGSAYSLILQELKKVNSKIHTIEDKVDNLSLKETEDSRINETDKSIADEIKKKNN